jgi:uncharacterized protein involved in high-affinity Fe2+ transport
MVTNRNIIAQAILGFIVLAAVAEAKEIPIGEAKQFWEAGLEVAAVYLQPIEMEPAVHHGRQLYLNREKSDIHLEADIHALRGNKQGFREDDWVPGLTIRYTLKNLDTGQEQSGILHPMVANDGPHYGVNVKMTGLGNYKLIYLIEAPGRLAVEAPVQQGFGRVSNAAPWWKPFQVEWTFKYFGPGKKGGY